MRAVGFVGPLLLICSIVTVLVLPSAQLQGQVLPVGIQVGHLGKDSGSFCDDNCNGKTDRGELTELSVTQAVAKRTVDLLRQSGYQVDVLPASVHAVHKKPFAAFVALHLDWCAALHSGYKVARWNGLAGPGWQGYWGTDGSGDASDQLVSILWGEYGKATGLLHDLHAGHFTPRMLTYYALNPVDGGSICVGDPEKETTQIQGINSDTPGAIIEMGWLSGDRRFITSVDGQERMAQGIANAIDLFLNRAPIVDGGIALGEWNNALEVPFANGVVFIRNDADNLYLLIDVITDTHKDQECHFHPEGNFWTCDVDYFNLGLDVDRNHAITAHVDLMYGVIVKDILEGLPPTEGEQELALCRMSFLAPGLVTGCEKTPSLLGVGFGASMNSPVDHRFWEIAIRLSEIESKPGRIARMGIQVSSPIPPIYGFLPDSEYPWIYDLSELIEIRFSNSLKSPPVRLGKA